MTASLFGTLKRNVLKSKRQLMVLALGALFIALKTFGKLQQQSTFAAINNASPLNEKKLSDLIYFFVVSCIYICAVPCVELLAASFEESMLKRILLTEYFNFTKYKYNDWGSFLKGDLFSVIIRRCKAFGLFYRKGFFEVSDTLFYIVLGIVSLISKYGFLRHFRYGLAFLAISPFFLNSLIFLRNLIERKSNEVYDNCENTLKDIILNYEMIHTYNQFDQEILNYKISMKKAKLWLVLYWISNDLLDTIYNIAKVLLIAVVFGTIETEKITQAHIYTHMTVFQSVSKRMNACVDHIKIMVEATENALHCKLDTLKVTDTTNQIRKGFFNSDIEVRDMAKRYNDNLIFENINLKINKGQKIAIAGANGSGKSSFVKSLIGIEPHIGELLIDQTNTSDIVDADLKNLICYVEQDPAIFDATVYENITAFNTKISPETVYNIAFNYGMNSDLKEIGYDTMLTDNGRSISSAMKQKICFMRAIIRDTPIIIFDEVTSDLDRSTEEYMINTIMSKMENKTVIMIVHNLDLLHKFDKVVFFGNKTCTGTSTLKELISENKDFQEFFNIPACNGLIL